MSDITKRGRGRPKKSTISKERLSIAPESVLDKNTNELNLSRSIFDVVKVQMSKSDYNEIKTPVEPGGGIKYDLGKLDWSLLPWEVIEKIVVRFSVGKEKYLPDSWKLLENGENRYEAAMMRHFCEYKKGNVWDEDPNFKDHPSTHLQAALWNLICLCWYEMKNLDKKPDES